MSLNIWTSKYKQLDSRNTLPSVTRLQSRQPGDCQSLTAVLVDGEGQPLRIPPVLSTLTLAPLMVLLSFSSAFQAVVRSAEDAY